MPDLIFNSRQLGIAVDVPRLEFDTLLIDLGITEIEIVDPRSLRLGFTEERITRPQPLPSELFRVNSLFAEVERRVLDLLPEEVLSLFSLRRFVEGVIGDVIGGNIPTVGEIEERARQVAESVVTRLVEPADSIVDRTLRTVEQLLPSDLPGIDSVARFVRREIVSRVPDVSLSPGALESFVTSRAEAITEAAVEEVQDSLSGVQAEVDGILDTGITEVASLPEFVRGEIQDSVPSDFLSDPAEWVFWTFLDSLRSHVSPAVAKVLRDVIEGFFELLLSDEAKQAIRERARDE